MSPDHQLQEAVGSFWPVDNKTTGEGAGRCRPRAACSSPDGFRWGDVWEWTASPFEPYPGFVPHPYRDYSAPWFDGRRVLRGASHFTQPCMRHSRYRNFFPATRNDVPAGFRSCAG